MAGIGGLEKIDIMLVTFNRLYLLKIAVRAIRLRTQYPHRLIVVDNGSLDGTPKWLKEQEAKGEIDTVILMEENVGVSRAYQKGLEYVRSEYFVTTADDLIPPRLKPCWLQRELETIKANPDHGGIAMRCARSSHSDCLSRELDKEEQQ